MVKKFFLFLIISVTIVSTISYLSTENSNKKETITLGASLPLSGINKELGKEVIEGANTYFKHINKNGGIAGKPIKFIYYDDKYEPQNTLKNTEKLINTDHVFSLFGFVGTPTTKKILPIIRNKKIPFIAPYTGASFLRDFKKPNIINFRSSYKQEIEGIINYLYNKKSITRFAIFYQNDDYGEEGYIATIESLEKRNLKLISEGTYKRNTLSIRHALHEIKATKPEAIIIVGAYKASARFIKKARECCKNSVIFAPISFVNANALIKELNGKGENILFSQTVPSYDDLSLNEAKEYKRLLHIYYPKSKPSFTSFEYFLTAKLVTIALQNTKDSLTIQNFLSNIKNLPSDTLGNIPIKYNQTQLLNLTYLSIYNNGKFKQISVEK